ncbi:site-specific recombinase XerD [Kineococcus xinjiangensis]|uniref:Site-specific recombinase XerD n=1 Tax=Kineococcus xinjiangensis TaxID=512762 RepID=A0A2S6IKH1_9ACTN|nr:site-specific integrase [Kineococcus xinjiangensis]PPK94724.1 site-specific recombinase XerD [Kineococcus xinjiangensis]
MAEPQLDLYGRTGAELALVDLAPAPPPPSLEPPALQEWMRTLPAGHRTGRSETTWRAYGSDLAHFAAWCADTGATPLPAEPATVTSYLLGCCEELSLATLQRRLAALSVAHRVLGVPSPTETQTVRLTWAGMRRTLGPVSPVRRVDPIVTSVLAEIVAPLGDSLLDRRDRALLVMGFAGALRRSELSGLDVADVEVAEEGLRVAVHATPAAAEDGGRTVVLPHGTRRATCPVRSWQAWAEAAGLGSGPAFLSVTKGGASLKQRRLSGQSIARMIKRRAEDAGLDPRMFSGHSLRAGFATAAVQAGLPDRSVMRQTGHRSTLALSACVRGSGPEVDNPAAHVGL